MGLFVVFGEARVGKLLPNSGCGRRICPDAIQHVLALLRRVARAALVLDQGGEFSEKHLPVAEAFLDFPPF